MNEWNIPMDQTIVIFIILFVITWKIWNLTNASEMIDKKEERRRTGVRLSDFNLIFGTQYRMCRSFLLPAPV